MKSYRNYRSSGYGYESVTELTEFPIIVARTYRTHRSSGRVQKCCYIVPVPRVFVERAYRAYKSSGYGYECCAELTEVPGTGMHALQNLSLIHI